VLDELFRFIEPYRGFQTSEDVSSKAYSNEEKENNAYEKLVIVLKEIKEM
jgi:hypothetical protein